MFSNPRQLYTDPLGYLVQSLTHPGSYSLLSWIGGRVLLEGWPEADMDLVCRGRVGTRLDEAPEGEGLATSVKLWGRGSQIELSAYVRVYCVAHCSCCARQ